MSYRITDEITGRVTLLENREGVDDHLDKIDPEHEERWRYAVTRHY